MLHAQIADNHRVLALPLVAQERATPRARRLSGVARPTARSSGSSATAGSAEALLDGFQPGILVSIAIAALGAAVTVLPLLGRYVPARVAVATGGDKGDRG